jgi:hypothetical protein
LCVNWAYFSRECQKMPNLHTNEMDTTFFCSTNLLPFGAFSKSLKIFKISLTFRFDKLWHLSKSVHTGENSQILIMSNKKKFYMYIPIVPIWERKIKGMLPYVIWGKTDKKLLLENAGNNKENNCKPDHSRSELLCHLLVKDK